MTPDGRRYPPRDSRQHARGGYAPHCGLKAVGDEKQKRGKCRDRGNQSKRCT